MKVDEKTAKLKSEHEEQERSHFCAASCKSTFDKDPHKYGHPNWKSTFSRIDQNTYRKAHSSIDPLAHSGHRDLERERDGDGSLRQVNLGTAA